MIPTEYEICLEEDGNTLYECVIADTADKARELIRKEYPTAKIKYIETTEFISKL